MRSRISPRSSSAFGSHFSPTVSLMSLPTVDFLGVDPDAPRVLGIARTRDHHPAGVKPVVPPEVVREMARASRPGIAALAERRGGHAIGWLERCDAVLAGGDADG